MLTYEDQLAHYKNVKARMSGVRPAHDGNGSDYLSRMVKRVSIDQHDAVEETPEPFEKPDSAAKPVRERIPGPARYRAIAREVCEKHGINFVAVAGRCRVLSIVVCRHELCYRLKTELGASYPAIGRYLGGRDHTTVMSGLKRHARVNGLPRSGEVQPC